jgi:hypothetical protein
VLNWPARVSGQIAADTGADPHLVQTLLQEHVAALLHEVAEQFDPAPGAPFRRAGEGMLEVRTRELPASG